MRTAYFILGMHRSGTSALASTLDGLGIPLGESLLAASEDNPKGYFENKAVQEFNETLLVSKGHGWDDVFFDIADINELDYQRLVTSATRILEKEFGCFNDFAVKDPRICILLPIWLDACRQLDIKPKVILAHRNPLEIAQSLKKRNGMNVGNALSLWADHMFKAEKYSRDIERVLISYEDLLNDFNKVSKSFSEFTGGVTSTDLKQATVIDKSLRHHKRSGEKLENVPDCLSVLLKQYSSGTLSAKELDPAMREFNSLKTFFFNANRTELFHQVFEERRKYKALKDDYFDKLQSSTEKTKKYQDELTRAKEELNKHRAEKKHFTESIQQRDERIRSETEKKNDLNKEINRLIGKLQKLELSEQHKEHQLNTINAELASLNQDKQKLENIRTEYEKLQLSNYNQQQKLDAQQKENEVLSQRIKELKESVEKRDERIRAELDKNKTLEREKQKLDTQQKENEILSERIKELKESVEKRDERIRAELDKNKTLEKESQKLEIVRNECETLKSAIQNQKEKLESQQKDNEILSERVKEFKESVEKRDDRIRAELDKNRILEKDNAQLSHELRKSEIEHKQVQQTIVELQKSRDETLSLNKQLEVKFRQVSDELNKLSKLCEEQTISLHELQALNESLNNDIQQITSELEESQNNETQLKALNETLNHDIQQITSELVESQNNETQLKALNETLNNDIQQITSELEESQNNETQLKALNETLNNDIQQITSELGESRQNEKELQALNKMVFEDNEQKDIEIEKLQRSNTELHTLKDTLSKEIKEKVALLETSRKNEKELQALNKMAFEDNQDKEIKLEKLKENNTELQKLNDALVADIEKQDLDLEQNQIEKKQLSDSIADLKNTIITSQANINSLTTSVKSIETQKSGEIKRLQSKLEDSLQINANLRARIDRLERERDEEQSLHQSKLERINAVLHEWAELVIAPMLPLAFDYKQNKQKHSRLTAGFKTAVLSGRLDNALQRLNKNIDAARNIPPAFISNFDEQGYYTCNEDVEVAVESGEFRSGLDHFLKFGYEETLQGKRKLHPKGTLFNPENKNADELPSLFNTFLATFYDEIAERQGLIKEAAKEISNNGLDKEPQAKKTKPSDISKGLMRPAPNHINTLKNIPSVDIILPVYNALDDVKACVESLYNNETVPFNLIIIDDCSEEETKVWLESAQKQYGFNLSRNTENLRFTKTVNKGFKQSSGDFVVLLNSDTIVTAYWLEKILCCFESDESVGIVGPLSNAASWQTVPEREDKVNGGWLVNEIPAGYSIELMGQLVETISQRQYPNVPSVNGFCYVIKRNVIDTIGTLDEEYFPTGYGEEDDFSIRARKAGFTIRVADDTYIFHAKSKSYTKEVRKVLTVGGRKSLDKKHGKEEIERLIAAWKAEPLLPEIGKDIKSFMHVSSGNSKVVFTAIFGNYDNLKTPEYINPDWDYVCFTDNKQLESDVFTIKHVNQRFENTTKNARMIKLLSHLFLINYDYSLWIDGSVKLRGKNINELITNNLADDYISLHNHVKRDCVYEEADACMLAKKDGTDILAKQIAHYRNEGFPEAAGVFETAEIIRRQYATDVEMLNSLWWQQLDKFSIRDQVALPYVFWKHKFKSFQMEGNQWLDPYFHMYKHRSAQTRNTTAVEILVNVTSAETNIEGVVKNIFDKTNYQNFNVTVLLGSSASIPNEAKASLQQTYADKLSFHNNEKANTPADLNSYIKRGKTKLCCLITEDTAFFNSDWLDVLVDGLNQDTKATFAGPTILSENFDFIASSVRVKRKQGQLKEIFNARKLGGTGAVLAIHQTCILFERQQFVRLGGFSNVFTKLRSAAIELFHRNNEDKKHTLLVGNSEVIVKNDCEEVEMEQLTKLL